MLDKLNRALIPAVPVPFDSSGALDEDAQRRYCRWMAGEGVPGVAVWTHTGRGLHLSPDQRERVFLSWREAIGEDGLIIAGVGSPHEAGGDFARQVDGATDVARHAMSLGADCLLCFPPTTARGRADEADLVVEYHQRLSTLGTPLLLFYLYEEAGGVAYSPDVLRRVLAIPGVAGVKVATLDSVMTFQTIAGACRDFPRSVLLSGEDRFLGYSLMMGARACLIGLAAARTALSADLTSAWFGGDRPAFFDASARVDRFAEAVFCEPMQGYILRLLRVLAADGVIPADAAHDPWAPPDVDAATTKAVE